MADPKTFVLPMSSHVFDRSHPSLMRDRLGAFKERAGNYDDRYDFDTFIYDCFYRADVNEVWLLGPKMVNLELLLADMTFSVDGREHGRWRVDHQSRTSIIRLKGLKQKPEMVAFTHPRASGSFAVNDCLFDMFAGTNAVFSINKDNRLEWIQDWLRFYVRAHGGNAVALCDNASETYSLDELCAAIDAVEGIDKAVVLSCPFPFGPNAEKKVNTDSLFLQRSMGELIRQRLFGQCRAVLSVDIDELFFSWSGQSVFDATAASEIGYVRANAEWVYVEPQVAARAGELLRHVHHGAWSSELNPAGKRVPKANRKWCVDPNGPYGDRPWHTHFLDGQKDPIDPDFLMLHCRQVSTSWKYERDGTGGVPLEPFPELKALMAKTFPEHQ